MRERKCTHRETGEAEKTGHVLRRAGTTKQNRRRDASRLVRVFSTKEGKSGKEQEVDVLVPPRLDAARVRSPLERHAGTHHARKYRKIYTDALFFAHTTTPTHRQKAPASTMSTCSRIYAHPFQHSPYVHLVSVMIMSLP